MQIFRNLNACWMWFVFYSKTFMQEVEIVFWSLLSPKQWLVISTYMCSCLFCCDHCKILVWLFKHDLAYWQNLGWWSIRFPCQRSLDQAPGQISVCLAQTAVTSVPSREAARMGCQIQEHRLSSPSYRTE